MKISLKRENLVKGLSIVGRMVKVRATLPVLSNIMIATDKGRIKLVSTDLEASVCAWIGGKIDEEGAVTVPARTLLDYSTTASDETISIVSEGSDVSIKGDRHHATIKGISAEEFPIIPEVKAQNPLKVDATKLKTAIFAVQTAAALDETRPVLAGILLRAHGKQLSLVATDSYRLAEKIITLDDDAGDFEVIIPQRTISEVARILPLSDEKVEISSGDNQVEFKFSDVKFISRQIEGSFPDYEQIIPKEFVLESILSKNDFAEAIKTANIFARDAGNNIKITASESDLLITAISSQTGDAETHLKAESKGTALSIAFNARYVLDALNVIEGDEVTLSLSGPLNPGLLTSKSEKGFRYVVMPLRSE